MTPRPVRPCCRALTAAAPGSVLRFASPAERIAGVADQIQHWAIKASCGAPGDQLVALPCRPQHLPVGGGHGQAPSRLACPKGCEVIAQSVKFDVVGRMVHATDRTLSDQLFTHPSCRARPLGRSIPLIRSYEWRVAAPSATTRA